MDVRARKLFDYKIGAQDGELGSVEDVLFDDHEWCVRYLVVDTAPWLFGRKVLIDPACIEGIDESRGVVDVRLTRQQVKDSPDIEVDPPLSREQQLRYHDHYDWPVYWGAGATMGTASLASGGGNVYLAGNTRLEPRADEPPMDDRDYYLRSTAEVAGYKLINDRREVGKLEDLLIDSDTWRVDAAVAELDRPKGKLILLPVQRIDAVTRDDTVDIELTDEALARAPEYHSDEPLEPSLIDRVRSFFKAA